MSGDGTKVERLQRRLFHLTTHISLETIGIFGFITLQILRLAAVVRNHTLLVVHKFRYSRGIRDKELKSL